MKNFYLLLLICLFFSLQSNAQSTFYSVPVSVVDLYVEDSAHVIGRLDLDFPVDGKVFVQFDGEGYSDTLDRIIVAANDYPDWGTNEGNVSFNSTSIGEGHCFSHTRMVSVSAGQHSFYAIAHNYTEIGGSGVTTIFGTLSVEYLPNNKEVIGESSITTDEYDAMLPFAYDSVTIETTGAGKVELRLNGNVDVNHGDVVMMGITDTKNWNYTDPNNTALEPAGSDEYYVGLSISKIVDVPDAGTYTYYVMAQRGYEEEGNGYIYGYTNFHARFYPTTEVNLISSKIISKENFNLGQDLRLLDSIVLNLPHAGTVEMRIDGFIQSDPGDQILLATNNSPSYDLQTGSVILETTNDEIDRHIFVQTQVYDVEPGMHTFYLMAEDYLGDGSEIDLHGNFLAKYYPDITVATKEDYVSLPFEISPNPAKDQISLQYQNEIDPVSVSILDLNGHTVLQERSMDSGNEIEVSTLPSGIYLVQLNNGKEKGYKKFVKE